MNRSIYKVLINNNEIASFYELEDVMIFIKGLCERYYEEIKIGLHFTIKEVLENDK